MAEEDQVSCKAPQLSYLATLYEKEEGKKRKKSEGEEV